MLLFLRGYFCSGWGERLLQSTDWEHLPWVPIWNKRAVSFHQLGDAALELSSVHISTKVCKLVGMFRVEGKDNIKEELLWFKKCFYIIISNELPARHNARFELTGTLITSRYKCSCVVKTLSCRTVFWTRRSVFQQSISFSVLFHL